MKASTRDLWTMALRNVARRPRRSALAMIAVGLAALTMTVMLSLVSGLKADLAANIQRYTTGQVLIEDGQMFKAGADTLAFSIAPLAPLEAALKARPGVAAISARITTGASVFDNGDAVFFSLMGLDFSSDPMRLLDFLLPGGSLPAPGEREALVSTGLAEKLGLKAGDTLTAVTQTLRGSSNGMTFRVTGVVRPGLATYQIPWLFTSLATAQRFVKLTDGATSLLVSSVPGAPPRALAADLQKVLADQGRTALTSRAWFETSTTWGLMDLVGLIYGCIGLVFFALASTVIVNTMLMVVLERSKEIGMLAALGMGQNAIRRLFLAESAVLSGAGAAVGTLAGCGITLVLGVTGLDFTEAMKGVDMGISSVLRPVLEVQTAPVVFVLAVAVALVFTLVPVNRLKKLQIVEALRGEL
jgi:putative ABC transport system permease protein